MHVAAQLKNQNSSKANIIKNHKSKNLTKIFSVAR